MFEKDVFNDINYTNKVLIAINKQKFFFIVEEESKKLDKNINKTAIYFLFYFKSMNMQK